MKLNRILRNEEGASPGGGAVPPAPAEPQAQVDAPVTMAALVEQLDKFKTSLKTEIVTEAKNGINADLRRAGVFKKDKEPAETPHTPSQPAGGSASAQSGLSLEAVEALLERERVIATRAAEYKLDDAKVRRLKSALTGVTPDRLAAEADSFLGDLGLAKAQPPTAQQAPAPAAQPQSNQPPISDKGSPAPGGVLDWEREYAENPIGMSPAARQRMDAKYGAEKARRMRVEAAQAQAERIRVTRPQG